MKMKKSSNKIKKSPIMFYLLCLILITFTASSFTISRYIATVKGEDSINAGVIVVGMGLYKGTEKITINLDDMIPGDEKGYDFCVTNTQGERISDVAFKFEVVLTRTTELPIAITLMEDWEGGKIFSYIDNKITTDYYSFNIGTEQTKDFIAYFDWDALDNSPAFQGKSDTITITVNWEQIMEPITG